MLDLLSSCARSATAAMLPTAATAPSTAPLSAPPGLCVDCLPLPMQPGLDYAMRNVWHLCLQIEPPVACLLRWYLQIKLDSSWAPSCSLTRCPVPISFKLFLQASSRWQGARHFAFQSHLPCIPSLSWVMGGLQSCCNQTRKHKRGRCQWQCHQLCTQMPSSMMTFMMSSVLQVSWVSVMAA